MNIKKTDTVEEQAAGIMEMVTRRERATEARQERARDIDARRRRAAYEKARALVEELAKLGLSKLHYSMAVQDGHPYDQIVRLVPSMTGLLTSKVMHAPTTSLVTFQVGWNEDATESWLEHDGTRVRLEEALGLVLDIIEREERRKLQKEEALSPGAT